MAGSGALRPASPCHVFHPHPTLSVEKRRRGEEERKRRRGEERQRRARLAPAPGCSPQARVLFIPPKATHHLDGARPGDAVALLSQGFQINDSLWHKGGTRTLSEKAGCGQLPHEIPLGSPLVESGGQEEAHRQLGAPTADCLPWANPQHAPPSQSLWHLFNRPHRPCGILKEDSTGLCQLPACSPPAFQEQMQGWFGAPLQPFLSAATH